MSFLDQLWDVAKGAAPLLLGGVAGTMTANPLIGGLVAKAAKSALGVSVPEGQVATITEQEAQAVFQDSELHLKFQSNMKDLEITRMQEETKQITAVNKTMQAEAMSGSKAQRGWRPFNGFAFGITLFCDYVVSQVVLAIVDPTTFVWIHIPQGVYMLWTALLGVTAGSRGFEKVAKTKAINGGMGNVMKTFLGGTIGR